VRALFKEVARFQSGLDMEVTLAGRRPSYASAQTCEIMPQK
jgi:hypothetical protein